MGGGLSAIFSGRRGRLLKTGQTTQYSSELDDGYYEKGRAKSYTVLTTGGYSGTVNIDLIHVTAATIAFAATTPGTITDSGNALAMFKDGETLIITGSASNDGTYTVSTGNVAGTIRTTEATLLEEAGETVSIAKREAHSNNCVLDMNTGLMWSRYTSSVSPMGTAGDGTMPGTGQLYDIFQYAAAANVASLGGYTDWQVPNKFELISLIHPKLPDSSAFPSSWNCRIWSSSADEATITYYVRFDLGILPSGVAPTAPYVCALVRGG